MKERGILFSAPMVCALLAGAKTQTRRAMKLREFGPSATKGYEWTFRDKRALWNDVSTELLMRKFCPYGVPGDRLWVREIFSTSARGVYPCPAAWYRSDFTKFDDPTRDPGTHDRGCNGNRGDCFACVADREGAFRWRPSIFMPRNLSRITLEVTEVRVQSLQSISEGDAKAEGVAADADCLTNRCRRPHFDRYMDLWDEINGKGAWQTNPWVWAISFKRVDR